MGINYQIRMFEKSIVDLFNSSELPIELKRLAFENTLSKITQKAEEVIQAEILEREETADGIHEDRVEE